MFKTKIQKYLIYLFFIWDKKHNNIYKNISK